MDVYSIQKWFRLRARGIFALRADCIDITVWDHRSSHIYMGSLPFCWATLRRVRCPHGPYFKEKTGYPTSPKTIGEMIRKRRIDLGLRQKDVAKRIGCTVSTVTNWEQSHTAFPQINHMARAVRFLGFNPLPNGDTVAKRLVNHR